MNILNKEGTGPDLQRALTLVIMMDGDLKVMNLETGNSRVEAAAVIQKTD